MFTPDPDIVDLVDQVLNTLQKAALAGDMDAKATLVVMAVIGEDETREAPKKVHETLKPLYPYLYDKHIPREVN